MNISNNSCFICGGVAFDKHTDEYQRCTGCGHEVLVTTQAQGFILNDPLTKKDVEHVTGLDRFKSKVLARYDISSVKGQLVDIGSASGKFLFLSAPHYQQVFGIEVTPDALAFSRKVLGLDIKEDVLEVPSGTTVATAWHSLEHIPRVALVNILTALSTNMVNNSRLIVSVPNGDSRQYRWFGKAYAYFDVPNHLHQFTELSLTKLMDKCGFKPVETINSWPYNTFGYVQSMLNITTGTHNYLYYRLKRRSLKPSIALDIAHVFLLLLLVPIGWLLGFLDAFDIKHQGVITLCFEKKPNILRG